MTSVLACLVAFAAYFVGYRIYAARLATRVFGLDDAIVTPAHRLSDGVDYVPTNRFVLFGHHYASITGLAPMLGPAVAVIWGWAPAMMWVVLGALLIGCVHDFGALVISLRADGMSIGKAAEGIIGKRAKSLFHLIIFFGIGLAMGVFVFVIGVLFQPQIGKGVAGYPQAVLPSGGLMVVAAVMGWLVYRKGWRFAPLAVAGFVLQLLLVRAGMAWPTLGLGPEAWPSAKGWMLILLGYAFVASVLPVWSLLQPRDFLNSLLLYLGLGASYLGFFVTAPTFAAPAFNRNPEGAPGIFPFVFIVIACGAASGFHSLVSSGTTAKQLDKESDARFVGYGGMMGESLLGLLAVLACTAGFAGPELWHGHYASWGAASAGLAVKIGAFVQGCSRFIGGLGVPPELASSFIAMVVVSFALTTLDSATRLLRFNIEEIAESGGVRRVPRALSGLIAVAVIAWFAFYEVDGKPAGLALWTLFGTVNQMLAGLCLLTVTLFLRQRGKSVLYTGIPMVFMLITTLTAMVDQIRGFLDKGQHLLLGVDLVLLGLAIWLTVEAALALRRGGPQEAQESPA